MRKTTILALAIFLHASCSLQAVNWNLFKTFYEQKIATKTDTEETVLIPELKAIVLLNQTAIPPQDLSVQGIIEEGVTVPKGTKNLQKYLGSSIWNRPLTQSDIIDIKQKIIHYYRDMGQPIVYVQVPSQEMGKGTLKLIVYEGVVGNVNVVGNRHFSTRSIKNGVRLHPGSKLNANRLDQDLTFLNRNPFRQVDAILKPGSEKGTVDVDLATIDRRTWRLYAGVDNTGLEGMGEQRYFTGFNTGNLFNLGHMFTYQFTTAAEIDKFYSHTVDYTVPLPCRHVLQIYGGYSQMKSSHIPTKHGQSFKSHGQSSQASLRYEIPLPAFYNLLEALTLGFDWKRTDFNLTFEGLDLFGRHVNLSQFEFGYNLGYENKVWKTSFTLENYWSPGQIMGQQTDQDFNALRPYAKNHYFYSRAAFAPIIRIPHWGMFIHLLMRGQYSTQNLLSSEQLGIGGYNTVRGYNERQLNADSGFIGNLELRSPFVNFWTLSKKKNLKNELQFLGFCDYGLASLHKASNGLNKSNYLLSYGAGIRYQLNPYLNARLDYGQQIHRVSFEDRDHKWHFGVIASY